MIVDLDVENFLDRFFDRLDPWVTELDDFPGIGQDHMIVLPIEVLLFILCLVFTELVFTDQLAIQQ